MAESKIVAGIDFSRYEAPYWSPSKGVSYELVMTNWREEQRDFKDGKPPKWVIVVDLLKIDGEEFAQGAKEFCSAAQSFAAGIMPLIKKAEEKSQKALGVHLTLGKDNQYNIIPLGGNW